MYLLKYITLYQLLKTCFLFFFGGGGRREWEKEREREREMRMATSGKESWNGPVAPARPPSGGFWPGSFFFHALLESGERERERERIKKIARECQKIYNLFVSKNARTTIK